MALKIEEDRSQQSKALLEHIKVFNALFHQIHANEENDGFCYDMECSPDRNARIPVPTTNQELHHLLGLFLIMTPPTVKSCYSLPQFYDVERGTILQHIDPDSETYIKGFASETFDFVNALLILWYKMQENYQKFLDGFQTHGWGIDAIDAMLLADRGVFVPDTISLDDFCRINGTEKDKLLAGINRSKNKNPQLRLDESGEFIVYNPYIPIALTILHGSSVSAPYIVFLYNYVASSIKPSVIYELGTGMGWQTSNLAVLHPDAEIVTVECEGELSQQAQQNIRRLEEKISSLDGNYFNRERERLRNIRFHVGDGSNPAQYVKDEIDLLVVTCGLPYDFNIESLLEKLNPQGGTLICPLGVTSSPSEELRVYVRQGDTVRYVNLAQVIFGQLKRYVS